MIVFASRTGNNRYIVSKLDGIKTVELNSELVVDEPYLLLTYTDGLGEVPNKVLDFLNAHEDNKKYLKGVIASGNSNFGDHVFCGSADRISMMYDVPIVRKIELRGFGHDIVAIQEGYKKLIVGEE